MHYYFDAFRNYAVFSGRARRQAYWLFVLFNIIAYVIVALIGALLHVAVLALVYALAAILPGLAVAARRLHDTNRTGWWLLIGLIPVLGAIVLLVFMLMDSQPGDNQYGPNPKGTAAQA